MTAGKGLSRPRVVRGGQRTVVTPIRSRHAAVAGAVASTLVALALWAWPSPAAAATCGGSRPCKCGDTVTASYDLTENLGPCPGHGLLLKSNVRLDCRGFGIVGRGNGSEQFGIFLSGKSGAEIMGAAVKGCRVSGFLRGIRLRSASNNLIVGNTASGNGDENAHVGYGIDVSGASHDNVFEGNQVRGNADEGVHVGRGSHKNRLVGNVIADNYRENLYVLDADRGVFLRNTLGGGGVNSLYLKDSSFNHFEGNTFLGRTARIIGDAHDNVFVGNTFSGAGLHFLPYKGLARHPSNNRVTGGTITEAEDCLRFTSSSGNLVVDTTLGQCGTAVRGESRTGPSENTLVGIDPASVALEETSSLKVGARVGVHVQDAAGAPVAGAQVQAKDAVGSPGFTAVTDESGNIPGQIVIMSIQVGGRTTSRTPLEVTVTKSGYAAEVRTVPVTAPLRLTVSLKPR